MDEHNNKDTHVSRWYVFGLWISRSEVTYFTQIVIIYVVIIIALINISIGNDNEHSWTGILGTCIGYLLPSPVLTKRQVISTDELDHKTSEYIEPAPKQTKCTCFL